MRIGRLNWKFKNYFFFLIFCLLTRRSIRTTSLARENLNEQSIRNSLNVKTCRQRISTRGISLILSAFSTIKESLQQKLRSRESRITIFKKKPSYLIRFSVSFYIPIVLYNDSAFTSKKLFCIDFFLVTAFDFTINSRFFVTNVTISNLCSDRSTIYR